MSKKIRTQKSKSCIKLKGLFRGDYDDWACVYYEISHNNTYIVVGLNDIADDETHYSLGTRVGWRRPFLPLSREDEKRIVRWLPKSRWENKL